jgi:hypothetical protein
MSPTTQTLVLKYLKHFAILAGLGAASVLLVVLVQDLSSLNVSALPPSLQGLAYLALPVVLAAAQKVKVEVDAEIAAAEAGQALMASQASNAALTAKLVEAKLI